MTEMRQTLVVLNADACRTYLVLAPKTVRRGADLTLSVSILRASRPVDVRAELKDSSDTPIVSNSINVAPGDEHYLHFKTLLKFAVL